MVGAGRVLADQKLLIKLLAGPQADIGDGDVAVGMLLVAHFETREADHGAGQVVNLDRRSHLQHEYFAPGRHRSRLDYELSRLRNRHEVADHVGMGHGHRTRGLDLVAKQLDHGTGRIEHVPEPHHGEDGRRAALLRECLKNLLGQSLACAHDIGRAHRLVARHKDETLDPELLGDFGHDQGAEGVVLKSREGVRLDDGNVLIGGSVIDHLDAALLNGAGHKLAVEHRSEHGDDGGCGN